MGLFEIQVITDPQHGLCGIDHTPMWNVDVASYLEYDLNMIKPALLFADRVNLVSFREDMRAIARRQGSELHMPMRRVWQYLHLCRERPQEVLDLLAIDAFSLPPTDEVLPIFAERSKDKTYANPPLLLYAFEEKYESSIADFAARSDAVWRSRYEGLTSPELDGFIKQSILHAESWSDLRTNWELAWEPQDDFFNRTILDLSRRLEEQSTTPLIDPGSQRLLVPAKMAAPPRAKASANYAVFGALVCARLPGLHELSVSEILDIRKDLDSPLRSFRSEVVKLADEVQAHSEASTAELATEADRVWERDVAPSLDDVRRELRRASYPRELLRAFTATKEAAVTATSFAVSAAIGSVGAGVSALLPAAVGAAYPFAKALQQRVDAQEAVRANRLYFLYAVHDQIRKSAKRKSAS